jgi:hypothetical protein
MCNRGVGIARTGLDNRADHFTWSSREGRMRISPGDRPAVIFFAYAHAREGKASKSASFARVAISLITLTH